MLNYEHLPRQSFTEPSLVAPTLKSNFSTEQAGAASKKFLVLLFTERPFCCFVLAAFFFSAQENDLAVMFSALCFFFQKRLLTLLAESLAVIGNCCYRKHADR